ncbi:MAG: hypothetical protein HY666_03635 [Chloroflexi bacterium]|nr:hypothetical protein [Chloroflexota bacterium]
MVKTKAVKSFLGLGLVGLLAGLLLVLGCARTAVPTPIPIPTPTPIPTIKVTMLVQVNEKDLRWYRDVAVPKGTNAYELTERITEGNLKAQWYPAFRSHFVQGILGVEGKAPFFWLIFLWDESEQKWEPLPVGSDLFSLHDGHALAWAYTDTSQKPKPLPVGKP